MRKYHEKLIEAMETGKEFLRVGNHSLNKNIDNNYEFIYGFTPIVTVDRERKNYITDNGGYNTTSTTQAINGYKEYFNSQGYTELK